MNLKIGSDSQFLWTVIYLFLGLTKAIVSIIKEKCTSLEKLAITYEQLNTKLSTDSFYLGFSETLTTLSLAHCNLQAQLLGDLMSKGRDREGRCYAEQRCTLFKRMLVFCNSGQKNIESTLEIDCHAAFFHSGDGDRFT